MRVPIYAASKGIPDVYLPEDPAKTGVDFLGWNLQSDGSGDYFAAGETMVQEDTILYAVWKETKIAMLPKGTTFNTSLKTLSAGEYAGYYRADNNLYAIQRVTSADEMEGQDVAELQASGEAVYAWVVKGVLYYYTEADTIYMNENSAQMFCEFCSLADISGLSYFDASNVTNGDEMFEGCNSLTNVDALSGWNSGNMESAGAMFSSCGSLSDISGLAKWDVSSVTDFGGFLYKTKISNLSPLKNWNLSSCENLSGFFNECYYITDLKPLATWDVSKVTGIDSMFAETSIVNLSGLEKWDVSSVVMVEEMLYQCTSLKDVSAIAGWNAENFQRLRCLCSGCSSLKDASVLSSWKIDSTLSNERMQFAFSDTGITDASLYPTWYYDYVSPVSAASVLTLDGNEGLVNGVSQINITAVDSSDEEILYEELEDEPQDI
jgi:surface protein